MKLLPRIHIDFDWLNWAVEPVPFIRELHKLVEIEIDHQFSTTRVGRTEDFEPIMGDVTWTNLDIVFYKRRLIVSIRGKWFKERKLTPVKVLTA